MLPRNKSSSTRTILILAMALLAVALHSPAAAQGGRAGLVAAGEPPDLMLLYTGDVIGYVDPCG
jgi:hypothetical protein